MSLRYRRVVGGALVLLLVLGVLAAALSVVGGGSGDSATADGEPTAEPTPTRPPPGPDDIQYVALGDSYAAAPGVPDTDPAGGCFRSDSNYANLLAEAYGLYLIDQTCSGATTEDVLNEQVSALSPDTDYVTIGIGGNDFGLFTTILQTCLSVGGAEVTGAPCSEALADQLDAVGDGIRANVGATLDAITAAAPAARVYVVGYPTLLPESGTCPDLVPFAAGDYPLLNEIVRGLSDALKTAAEERGLPFVDVYTASLEHDVCSDEPWINGADIAPDGTIPFHPFGVQQQAVAALIGDLR